MPRNPQPKRLSLEDYAAANPLKATGSVGWLSTIPEFDMVVAAWRAGMPPTQIRNWLTDSEDNGGCGYDPEIATDNRVAGWLNKHVKRDGPQTTR